jgi:hypothetical protein
MLYKITGKFRFDYFYVTLLILFTLISTSPQNIELSPEYLSNLESCELYSFKANYEKNLTYSASEIKNTWVLGDMLESESYSFYLQQNYLNSFQQGFSCLGKITEVENLNNSYYIKVGVLDKLFQVIKFVFVLFNTSIFYFVKKKNKSVLFFVSSLIITYNLNLYFNYDFLYNIDYKYYSPYRELIESAIFSVIIIRYIFKEKIIINSTKGSLLINRTYNLLIVAYLLRITYLYNSKFQYSDVIQEWFINYKYGFVRRGLAGSILLKFKIFNQDDIEIPFLIFLLFIYLLYLIQLKKLLITSKNNLLKLFFVASPAFLIFNLFWGSSITFPKEILGFLAYFYFLNYFEKFQEHLYLKYFFLILFIISIFSHEINLWILPFLIILIMTHPKRSEYISLALLLLTISLLFIALLLSADNQYYIAEMLCESTYKQYLPNSDCSKSQILSESSISDNYTSTADTVLYSGNFKYYITIYTIYFLLGFLPILLSKWFFKNKLLFFITFISFIPLFVIAVDWGRWLNLYFTLAYATILYFDKSKYLIKDSEAPSILIIIAIAYSTLWSIPQCCVTEYSFIYLFNSSKFNITLFFLTFVIICNLNRASITGYFKIRN